MNKEFWKSLTFWGAVLLFIGSGVEAIGVAGALLIIEQIAFVFGIPLTVFGIRRALK